MRKLFSTTVITAIAALALAGCYEYSDTYTGGPAGDFLQRIYDETAKPSHTLTVSVNPTIGGYITVNGTRISGTTSHKSGTTVTVTAIAASGYVFTGWAWASASTSSSIRITMDSDQVLRANFALQSGGADIVTNAGEAWVFCETYEGMEMCNGLAFHDGKFFMVSNEFPGGAWFKMEMGTYSTSGGRITVNWVDPEDGSTYTETEPYSVSGNKLTIGSGKDSGTFTLKTGLTFMSMEEYLRGMCENAIVLWGYPGTVEECMEESSFKRRETPRNLLKSFKDSKRVTQF